MTFCSESVRVNTSERDGIFEKYFFSYFLKLGYTEKNFAVQLHIINSLVPIRTLLIDNGETSMLVKLNSMIQEMRHAPNMHPEAFKQLYTVCNTFKTQD